MKSFSYQELIQFKPPASKLYLVGGAVRDLLLQKESRDFDFVCDCDTRTLARSFANEKKGAFFVLDAERNTSRVIFYDPPGKRVFVDFARLHSQGLEADLKSRDFTINAMALDLAAPDRLIDPLGGAADLKSKLLRACSPRSFREDPVRVIRAVRYAVSLNLTILPDTLAALKPAVPLLVAISRERNRDELLKVLETGKPEIGLELLQRLGILEVLGIHSSEADWVAAVQHVGAFEALIAGLEGIGKGESAQALPITSYLLRMGRFRKVLLEHFHQSYSSGRTCRTLDLLAAYLTHFTRTDYENSVERLVLSNEEKAHLLNLYDHRMDLNDFPVYPERRQIYRFFKESSLDQCFLWLSDLFRLPATEHSTQSWLDALEKCEQLVEAWAEKPELLSPTPLLNGKDLMLYFDLPPGKLLGSLLEALLEEQAAGTITSREEALQWVENHLPARGLQ